MKKVIGTGTSVVVTECQICRSKDLDPVLFLGYLPSVNLMPKAGEPLTEEPSFPAQVLQCRRCKLAQLGLIVDARILFPPEYPYSSGTTKILRENFADLYRECRSLITLKPEDLAVDIGSNDGTLLSNFKDGGHRVLGIEPTQMGKRAQEKGIETIISFFGAAAVDQALKEHGQAKVITATNVFAHIEQIDEVIAGILKLLKSDGVFISESHYWLALVETLQFDTIYHEHLRYYSLGSLQYLLNRHDLEIFHVKRIPTHGGSIRAFAARKGSYPVTDSVAQTLRAEKQGKIEGEGLNEFRERVVQAKWRLQELLLGLKKKGKRIYGVGAPSRASTLVNYAAIDEDILDCVLEVKGSYKIGRYMPGTLIPVVEEERLVTEPPDYLLLLSWHIAEELKPKLRAKGFKGEFIIPLPEPTVGK